MKSVGYCHSEERSDVGIRSLRLVDENNGLPRRPIGPPRNDKALQSVPIQNLRKIPVFFKYRHNKQSNRTALCNNTFYHGMGGFSRGELKVSERQMKGTTGVHPLSGWPTQRSAPTASYDGFRRGGPLCPPVR